MTDLVLAPAGPASIVPCLAPWRSPSRHGNRLFDAARALLPLGHDPAEVVSARHAGERDRRHARRARRPGPLDRRGTGPMRYAPASWKPRELADSSFAEAPETADDDEGGHLAPAASPALERAA